MLSNFRNNYLLQCVNPSITRRNFEIRFSFDEERGNVSRFPSHSHPREREARRFSRAPRFSCQDNRIPRVTTRANRVPLSIPSREISRDRARRAGKRIRKRNFHLRRSRVFYELRGTIDAVHSQIFTDFLHHSSPCWWNSWSLHGGRTMGGQLEDEIIFFSLTCGDSDVWETIFPFFIIIRYFIKNVCNVCI